MRIAKYRKQTGLRRIVSECRGSWRWQDAYRVATYRLGRGVDGALRWYVASRSCKLSWPQILRAAHDRDLPAGTIHRRAFTCGDVMDYAERAIESGVTTWAEAARYTRLARRLVAHWPEAI